jgi:hypothetical protein
MCYISSPSLTLWIKHPTSNKATDHCLKSCEAEAHTRNIDELSRTLYGTQSFPITKMNLLMLLRQTATAGAALTWNKRKGMRQ